MSKKDVPVAPQSPSLKFITAVKSEAQWKEQVMEAPASTLCVCDIYQKWCGPCVALGKRITNLSSDYMEYARIFRSPTLVAFSLIFLLTLVLRFFVLFASPCSYDVKWVEVCADDVQKFADSKTTKPLIILYKSGLEKGRMDKGANGNELARLVEANKGPKKES